MLKRVAARTADPVSGWLALSLRSAASSTASSSPSASSACWSSARLPTPPRWKSLWLPWASPRRPVRACHHRSRRRRQRQRHSGSHRKATNLTRRCDCVGWLLACLRGSGQGPRAVPRPALQAEQRARADGGVPGTRAPSARGAQQGRRGRRRRAARRNHVRVEGEHLVGVMTTVMVTRTTMITLNSFGRPCALRAPPSYGFSRCTPNQHPPFDHDARHMVVLQRGDVRVWA
eukprot:scaffold1284_cov353-Prasinococcus_capsulatus_cf.AAC.3